jgi:predicted Fe-Mo cluster-binding NifX family protein
MSERVVVPVLDDAGEASALSPHFGRAPFFAVAEMGQNGIIRKVEFHPNRGSHMGGEGRAPDLILALKPDAVITQGMGIRAMQIFQAARVAVLQTSASTLRDALAAHARKELKELTEGCREARHQPD